MKSKDDERKIYFIDQVSKSTGHVLSLNTNIIWSQQLKFIQQTSGQLCHCQPGHINPPASKYDSAGNIQMISYCKLTMTQLSCQLSHFNISYWILWHLCHSAVTVTPATHLQCRPRARRGNKLWQPHQHGSNRFVKIKILMFGSFTAYSFFVITFVTCPLLWEKGKKVAQNVVSVWSGGRQSVLLIYLVWQFIFLTSILQLIKLWKFGHQNNDDS